MEILLNQKIGVMVHFATEEDVAQGLSYLNLENQNYIKEVLEFKGEENRVFESLGPNSQNLIVIGLGKEKEVDGNTFRMAAFTAAKFLNSKRVKEATLICKKVDGNCSKKSMKAVLEGALQEGYAFDKYMENKKKRYMEKLSIVAIEGKEDSLEEVVETVKTLMEGVNLTRDLVNEPANVIYPESLAQRAVEALSPLGVEVTVYGKKEIEEIGMKAFLEVARGSDKEPKFIVMKYLPEGEDKEAVALVGKGLTYDAGGYAIKPATGMVTMKADMGGSGAVIGAIYALAKNKVKKNVIGLVAACENLISGDAYKNGDIIETMMGKTIEVINTDAEGRLTLADAIYYAATKVNSSMIVDLATLTGACVVALGEYTTGAVTNTDELYEKIAKAAERSGESVWRLPVIKEMRNLLKGSQGDLKNSTGRFGGAITAGAFLEEFCQRKPWIHLDIAGPAYTESAYSYIPKGASGIPVKTLYNFINDMAYDCKHKGENK